MSLGWLTESALMPKKPREIEEVGKSSMFDLRAAMYQSEEAVSKSDGGVAAAAQAEERRRRERRQGVFGSGQNRGVAARSASDLAHEQGEDKRITESLKRKVGTRAATSKRIPASPTISLSHRRQCTTRSCVAMPTPRARCSRATQGAPCRLQAPANRTAPRYLLHARRRQSLEPARRAMNWSTSS